MTNSDLIADKDRYTPNSTSADLVRLHRLVTSTLKPGWYDLRDLLDVAMVHSEEGQMHLKADGVDAHAQSLGSEYGFFRHRTQAEDEPATSGALSSFVKTGDRWEATGVGRLRLRRSEEGVGRQTTGSRASPTHRHLISLQEYCPKADLDVAAYYREWTADMHVTAANLVQLEECSGG